MPIAGNRELVCSSLLLTGSDGAPIGGHWSGGSPQRVVDEAPPVLGISLGWGGVRGYSATPCWVLEVQRTPRLGVEMYFALFAGIWGSLGLRGAQGKVMLAGVGAGRDAELELDLFLFLCFIHSFR